MNTRFNFRWIGLFGVVLITMACALAIPTARPQTDEIGTVVAATLQALTTVPTHSSGTPFSFNNVSFVIPAGMADGANAEVLPTIGQDQGGPWAVAPAHITITLSGYSTTNDNEAIHNTIEIYPAREYMDVNQGAADSISKLQTILAHPATPINPDTAPGIPAYNAAQVIVAQPGILDFQTGSGVRSITEYAQFPAPITKNGELYQYEGLTNDGKYYIIVVLPIQTPLQSTADNPSADGWAYPERGNGDEVAFKAYYQAMTETLNAADPNSFQPTLGQLDALVQSIRVTP